jgi:plastocyanin
MDEKGCEPMRGIKLVKVISLWLLVGVVLSLLSAGAALAAASGPVIESFSAHNLVIKAGNTVTLKWKVTNAAEIEIIGIEKGDEIALPLEGSIETWPLTTTSYVLIAYGLDGTIAAKSLTVNVGTSGTVKIDYFKAAPLTVTPMQTVLLSWKITNGVSSRILGLSPKDDEVIRPIEGSIEAWPEVTTVYILEATGVKGEIASAAVAVNVTKPTVPKVLSFTASKTTVSKGEMITLTWTTENAVKCTIKTGSGAELSDRPPSGKIAVTISKTQTFTLYAYDASGQQAQASIEIVVK